MASETELQSAIMKALKKIGIWCIRINSGRFQGLKGGLVQGAEDGTPDLMLPALGFLEVKLPGEKLRESQKKWHARAEREGVRVAVVSSVGDAVRAARGWKNDGARRP